jgi:hypothetical protein
MPLRCGESPVRALKLLAPVFIGEDCIILPFLDIMPTLPEAANLPCNFVGDCVGDPGEFGPVDFTAEDRGDLHANYSCLYEADLTKSTAY